VKRRLGLHASTAGGLDNAALHAADVGANCIQIFSSSPRMWRASPVDPSRARALRLLREKHDIAPVAIHCNYLINMAATNEEVLRQSIISFRGELERAVAIGADFLVLHPGSRKGHASLEGAIQLAAASVATASKGLKFHSSFRLLFENTAGAGQSIGSTFEELAEMSRLVHSVSGVPTGYCIDTCHCLVSGYNVATRDGLTETVQKLDKLLGLENIGMFHANDSKGVLGSHLDRHANIGDGHIGEAGFKRILNHPKLRATPFILETPMDEDGGRRDLATLKRLSGVSQ
jgi:deoxyribonuclease IV